MSRESVKEMQAERIYPDAAATADVVNSLLLRLSGWKEVWSTEYGVQSYTETTWYPTTANVLTTHSSKQREKTCNQRFRA